MKFNYKAKDASGNRVSGSVEALSRRDASGVLQENGLVPIAIFEAKAKTGAFSELHRIYEGVRKKELVVFFRQLATLIGAKVTVLKSIRAIQEQTDNTYFRSVLRDVGNDIEDGSPMSESFGRHPLVFDRMIVSMLASGEVSGNLQKTIEYIANNIESNYQLTSKIRGALIYPAFVILAALSVGFIVVTFILPRITQVVRDLNVEPEWHTKIVMSIGDFMSVYWWAVLALIFFMIIGIIYYLKSESGRREWEIIQLEIPVIGQLLQNLYIARFADNLSILLRGGIPLVKSLVIVSNVVGNSVYQAVIFRAADEVKRGGKLSTAFRRDPAIPPVVVQMLEVGEESGQLSEILGSAAHFYKQEADNMAKTLSTLIEPIMIIILGIGVGILVFSVLIPIYSIAGQL